MMKSFYTAIIFFFCLNLVTGQTLDPDKLFNGSDSAGSFHSETPDSKSDLETDLEFNSSFWFASKGINGQTYSLSPKLSYGLTDRLSIHAGVSFGFGRMYMPWVSSDNIEASIPFSQQTYFAGGTYLVNPKLQITASAYQSVFDVPYVKKEYKTESTYTNKGMSVGFNYQITKNISFGASVSINDPGYMSPYNRQGFGNFGYGYMPLW